jgi:phosphoglycerol transferase MdoB-like AlkP superfamily enzyme
MVDGKDFPPSDVRTNWGYSDRALARRAARALDAAREPFAAMVLTVSNHHPFQLPADADPPFPGLSSRFQAYQVRMLQTIHYTDEAVGDLFRLVRTRPWFSRTVFVISGDHGLSVTPYEKSASTLSGLTELRHHVPLIIYSPMLRAGRVSGVATQADVPETLLGLAGVATPRTGLGRDLLDPEQTDALRRVVTWSSEGSLVTVRDGQRVYHASVPGDDLSGGRPVRLTDEILIDPRGDPDRKRNLLSREPEAAESYRRVARVYLDVYPWLLLSGRSGLPEDLLRVRR